MEELTTEEKVLAAATALLALANELEKKGVPEMREGIIAMRAASITMFELYKAGMIAKKSHENNKT